MRFRVIHLIFVVTGLVVALAPWPARPAAPQARTFRVEAREFAYSPSEIKVDPGDTVTIRLVSTDVVHGLYIDGYDISVEADLGKTATLTFTANQAGSFRVRCNITCGAMHPFMIGRLSVGTNEWLYRSIGLSILGVIAVLPLSPLWSKRKGKKDVSVEESQRR